MLEQDGQRLVRPVAVLLKVHLAQGGAVVVQWLAAADPRLRLVAAPSWAEAELSIERALDAISHGPREQRPTREVGPG